MKNNRGFTLIELLAVIVVLAIVMVLAATTVLPYMGDARENAFKIEATNVVTAAESAKDLYAIGKVSMNADSTKSCTAGTTMCFTVDELISLGIYEADAATFYGKVVISNYNTNTPTYTLHLKKNDEFSIIGGTGKDYSDYSGTLTGTWPADGATCSCS